MSDPAYDADLARLNREPVECYVCGGPVETGRAACQACAVAHFLADMARRPLREHQIVEVHGGDRRRRP